MKLLFFAFFFFSSFLYSSQDSKKIIIDLSSQRLYAIKNGVIDIESKISSGKNGYRTIVGNFKVLYKDIDHKSSKYPKRKNGKNGGAKMPYTLMFHKKGYAIHSGYVPNRRASHGCVRVPPSTAKKLFSWAKAETPVIIKNHANISGLKRLKHSSSSTNRKTQNSRKVSRKAIIKRRAIPEAIINPPYKGWENPWGR